MLAGQSFRLDEIYEEINAFLRQKTVSLVPLSETLKARGLEFSHQTLYNYRNDGIENCNPRMENLITLFAYVREQNKT